MPYRPTDATFPLWVIVRATFTLALQRIAFKLSLSRCFVRYVDEGCVHESKPMDITRPEIHILSPRALSQHVSQSNHEQKHHNAASPSPSFTLHL